MFCTSCGAQLPDESRFCTSCGASVEQRGTAQRDAMQQAALEPVAQNQAQRTGQGQPPKRRGTVLFAVIASVAAVAAVAVLIVVVLSKGHGPIAINETTFPDETLRRVVTLEFDLDGNGELSPDEVSVVTSLDLDGAADLTGIEVFDGLEDLTVRNYGNATFIIPEKTTASRVVVQDSDGVSEVRAGNNQNIKSMKVSGKSISAVDISGCTQIGDFDGRATGIKALVVPPSSDFRTLLVEPDVEIEGLENTPLREYWLPVSISSSEFREVSPRTFMSTAEYDDQGRVTKLTYDSSKHVEFSYQYDNDSRITTIFEDGAYSGRKDLSYDDKGRLTSIRETSNTGSSDTQFTYGDDGRTLHAVKSPSAGATSSYDITYDEAGRVRSSVVSWPNEWTKSSFEYNADGLLASFEFTTSSAGQTLVQVTWTANRRVATIEESVDGRRFLGTECAYAGDGRAESVYQKTFSASGGFTSLTGASSFVYGQLPVPSSWTETLTDERNGGGEPFTSPFNVEYERFITADEGYRPQNALSCSNPFATGANALFWDPTSVASNPRTLISDLPILTAGNAR